MGIFDSVAPLLKHVFSVLRRESSMSSIVTYRHYVSSAVVDGVSETTWDDVEDLRLPKGLHTEQTARALGSSEIIAGDVFFMADAGLLNAKPKPKKDLIVDSVGSYMVTHVQPLGTFGYSLSCKSS